MSSALQCKHSLRFGPSRLHLCTCIIAKVAMNAKLFRRLKTNSDFFPQYASSPTLSTNTLASVCIALICNNTGPSIALNLPSSLHWVEASRSPFLTPTGLKHSARPSSHLLGRSIALALPHTYWVEALRSPFTVNNPQRRTSLIHLVLKLLHLAASSHLKDSLHLPP